MGLKCTNSNGEIVLAKKLNHVELLFWKNCRNCIQIWILQVIFSKRCLDCLKNEIVHKFYIFYPNEWIKAFNIIDKNVIYGEKKFNSNFWNFFCCLVSLILSIIFVSRHQLNFFQAFHVGKNIIYKKKIF